MARMLVIMAVTIGVAVKQIDCGLYYKVRSYCLSNFVIVVG